MSRDPEKPKRTLSQARLGVLMGHRMGDKGFSGAAVSDWELGKSKISAEDRKVLVTLVKVLYQCGGVRTQEDANQILETGNYRALNKEEAYEVFGELPAEPSVEQPILSQEISKSFPSFLLEKLFSLWDDEVGTLLENIEKGPPPSWPRLLAALMRKISDQLSLSPKTVFWMGIWWIAWWLVGPPCDGHLLIDMSPYRQLVCMSPGL